MLDQQVLPLLERGDSWEGVLDVFDSAGRRFPLWERADTIRDNEGKMLYSFGFMHDVSERRNILNALRESETRLREVLENSLDVSYKRNLATNVYEYLSPVFERISGYSSAEMMTMPVEKVITLIHPDDRTIVSGALQAPTICSLGEARHCTYRFKHKNGEYRWFHDKFIVICDNRNIGSGLIGSVSDITDQKRVLDTLDTERKRLAAIIEGTHVGTWEWNVQTGETVFNNEWAQIIGYSLEELSPLSIKTWERFAHPDDLRLSGELLEKHFSGELPYYDCECRMRHKKGHWVWVHDRGRVDSFTPDGKPLMMFGTHTDISARKHIEEELQINRKELQEQKDHFERLVSMLPVAVFYCDEEFNIIYMNNAGSRLFGCSYSMCCTLGSFISTSEYAKIIEKLQSYTPGTAPVQCLTHCVTTGDIMIDGILTGERFSDHQNRTVYLLSFIPLSEVVEGELLPDDSFYKQHKITKRERQVLEMLLKGESRADIIKVLGIAEGTLKKHLFDVYERMKISTYDEFCENVNEHMNNRFERDALTFSLLKNLIQRK